MCNVQVSSPYGNELHYMDGVPLGNFAFTSRESGLYLACFWVNRNDRGGEVIVDLDWKTGIAAKDWDSVAKREKIEVKISFIFYHNSSTTFYFNGFGCTRSRNTTSSAYLISLGVERACWKY